MFNTWIFLASLGSFLLLSPAAPIADEPPPAAPWQSHVFKDSPLVGKAWSVSQARYLSPKEVLDTLAQADFIMLGEKHDNPDHHRLQTWVTQALMSRGRRLSMGFEMINTDKSPLLTKTYKTADALGAALKWDQSGWGNWAFYRPMIQTARKHDLPVLATNLPKATIKAMGKDGVDALKPETRALYGLNAPLPAATMAEMATEIRESHCNMLPERFVPRMVSIQRAKDASMALELSKAAKAILITGAMHARTDRGVPAHLKRFAPDKSVVSLTFQEVDEEAPLPVDYARHYGVGSLPFDIIWFTPRLDSENPCDKYAKQLQKLREK